MQDKRTSQLFVDDCQTRNEQAYAESGRKQSAHGQLQNARRNPALAWGPTERRTLKDRYSRPDGTCKPLPTFRAMDWLRHHFTRLGVLMAHPAAFFVVLAFTLLWLVLDRGSFDWHAVATLATLVMTLFIQRSEHRDTQAIHAKLDELLRSNPEARTELAHLDDEEPEEIEEVRHRKNGSTGRPSH